MAGEPKELVLLSRARQALEQATTIDEVKDIRDKAEAVRAYHKQAGESLEAQNFAAEIKLRAERKGGALLAAMEKSEGGRPCKTGCSVQPVSLADMGIEKTQSHRWQRMAELDDEAFENHIEAVREAGKELTTAGVLRLAAGEPEPASEWTLPEALERVTRLVRSAYDRWPKEHIETLAHKLRAMGDEILEQGGPGA